MSLSNRLIAKAIRRFERQPENRAYQTGYRPSKERQKGHRDETAVALWPMLH